MARQASVVIFFGILTVNAVQNSIKVRNTGTSRKPHPI